MSGPEIRRSIRARGAAALLALAAAATCAAAEGTFAAASAQEVGGYAAWLARDVNGMRSLKGGGAYVSVAPRAHLDVRLDLMAAGRTRLGGTAPYCDPRDAAGPCVEERLEEESRLSSLELSAVAWTRPVIGTRLGLGAGIVRHAVTAAERGVLSGRRTELVDGRDAFGTALSLHVRVSPPFSPGAVAFAALHRSFVQHTACYSDAGVCGGSGAASLRLGVAYRFGGLHIR